MISLTGDRPSCKGLHLGHYAGSLCERLKLQKESKQFIMIADYQVLTDQYMHPEKINQSIIELMKDYLAVGLTADQNTFFLQSHIPALTELFTLLLNFVTIPRLMQNPTVKTELKTKSFKDNILAGFLSYPVSQAADILMFQTDIVPVGEDQLPMIEQTNDIAKKVNNTYKANIFKEVEPIVSRIGRLVGIDGRSKASKSLGNAILLSDSPDEIKRKVFAMYTDPNHIAVSDPGQIEGNVVFQYLDAFYTNTEHLNDLKSHYQRGGLGDVTIKNMLNDILQEFLEPIRHKRNSISNSDAVSILREHTSQANDIASTNLKIIKDKMCLFSLEN